MAINELENRPNGENLQTISESVKKILDGLSNEQKKLMFELLKKDFSNESFRDPEYCYDSEFNNFGSIHSGMDEEEYEEYYNDDSDEKREYEEFGKEPLPEWLSEYRLLREQKIRGVSPEAKEKIKKASENIKCEVEKFDNGARKVHLKFGKHGGIDLYFTEYLLDSEKVLGKYAEKEPNPITGGESINVNLAGIEGPNPDNWEDYKVRGYYAGWKKQPKVPTNEGVRSVLNILGNFAELHEERDQIALMMYLTGMEGTYWLEEGYETDLLSSKEYTGNRVFMVCEPDARGFGYYFYESGNNCLNGKLFSIDGLLYK